MAKKKQELTDRSNLLRSIKYRWEFLRRNSEYRTCYDGITELRKSEKCKPEEIHEHYQIGSEEYENEKARIKYFNELEEKACKKFGIRFPPLPDPEKELNELFDLADDGDVISALLKFNAGAFTELSAGHLYDDWDGKLTLQIDFSKLNSVPALLEILKIRFGQLDELYKNSKGKGKKYIIDYDLILKAGDMRSENIKSADVARKIFPRDFNPNNSKRNPESATRKIKHYYKTYKMLINGGYKDITFQ